MAAKKIANERTRSSRRKTRAGNNGISGFEGTIRSAVQDQFAAITDLPTFLRTAGELTSSEREAIVDQALIVIDQVYVHLPLKRAMYGIDPVQRLRLLRTRLLDLQTNQQLAELQFHRELTDIFTELRDLHTIYQLPAPYNGKIAFLPFLIEEYYENNQRKYLLSKLIAGFTHPTFQPGVEILYWNGTPIDRAVILNGERQGGSNPAARQARGLHALTLRAMCCSIPPDEEWVIVTYRSANDEELELKQPWQVFEPEAVGVGGGNGAREITSALFSERLTAGSLTYATDLGLDIHTTMINRARKVLYAPEVVKAEQQLAAARGGPVDVPRGEATSMPQVIRAENIVIGSKTYAHLRIFSFIADDIANFVPSFVDEAIRLVQTLSQHGLIIDVRNNGGGYIAAGELLLQLFTPKRIEPEPFRFINTPLALELCEQEPSLQQWVPSIRQSTQTGATYSQGFPLTSPDLSNVIGQIYYGPVVLITDALCYSTTDIFAAGFQDHNIGPILGIHASTGAGGANVWTHDTLRQIDQRPDTPFRDMPKQAEFNVAVRGCLRVGERAGMPLEDFGVQRDVEHRMTRNDLLNGNVDLLARAGELLDALPVRTLSLVEEPTGSGAYQAVTIGLSRLDVYLDGRPQRSLDIVDGKTALDLNLSPEVSVALELRGFDKNELVAVHRRQIP